jgi:type IV pilus assembly protein PilC
MSGHGAFAGRAIVRAMRDGDSDPQAAVARVSQALDGRLRDAAGRIALALESGEPQETRAAAFEPVADAVATVVHVRRHGGRTSAAFWDLIERNLSSQTELLEALSLASRRSQAITFATAAVAVVMTTMYLLFVLPQLEQLFTLMRAELPELTRLALAGWFQPLIFAGLGFVIAGSAIALVRPRWVNGLLGRQSRAAGIALGLLRGGRVARNYRLLLFVDHAAALTAAGIEARETLAAASRYAGVFAEIDFRSSGAASAPDAIPEALLAALRLDQLPAELETQHGLRLEAVLQAADRAQLQAAFTIRSFLYALIALLILAMYLPIFKLGAAI